MPRIHKCENITVITHLDADGVLCLSAFLKLLLEEEDKPTVKSFFTSPVKLLDTICVSIIDRGYKELEDLYIFDLTGNRESITASSIYKKAFWMDHHKWDFFESPKNVLIHVNSSSPSATRLLSEYYSYSTGLENFADEIDKNDIKSMEAEKIRDIIGAFRLKYSDIALSEKLCNFATALAINGTREIHNSKYDALINEYSSWLKEAQKTAIERVSTHTVEGMKVAIVELNKGVPVFSVYNKLLEHKDAPFDVIAVLTHIYGNKKSPHTKIEFRTQTGKEVYKLAKLFGGGGHSVASGATVSGIVRYEDILRAIRMLVF